MMTTCRRYVKSSKLHRVPGPASSSVTRINARTPTLFGGFLPTSILIRRPTFEPDDDAAPYSTSLNDQNVVATTTHVLSNSTQIPPNPATGIPQSRGWIIRLQDRTLSKTYEILDMLQFLHLLFLLALPLPDLTSYTMATHFSSAGWKPQIRIETPYKISHTTI